MSSDMSMTIEVTPSEITQYINELTPLDQPTFIWGPPGIGKSSIVFQSLAKDEKLVDLRLSYIDPVDLHGLPVVRDDTVHFLPMGTLPIDGKGILLLDEIINAPRAVQSAALQLCLDRRIGEYILPDGYKIVAASNRLEDRAGGNPLISSLGSRFTHFDMMPHIDDWTRWALDPKQGNIDVRIVGFLKFKNDMLQNFDPNQRVSPNPRAWSFVNRIIKKNMESRTLQTAAISGTVGRGAAGELAAYMKVCANLPDIDQLIFSPESGIVPTDPCTLYALTGSLANKVDMKNLKNIIIYLERLSEEFNVFAIKAILQYASAKGFYPNIVKSKFFVDWCIRHQEVLTETVDEK